MSYNNYLDADAAWNCVSEFKNPTCVIVKHTNPCGVASRDDILEAYRLAVKADPVSAFGGIVAFNIEVDEVSLYVLILCAYSEITFCWPSSFWYEDLGLSRCPSCCVAWNYCI